MNRGLKKWLWDDGESYAIGTLGGLAVAAWMVWLLPGAFDRSQLVQEAGSQSIERTVIGERTFNGRDTEIIRRDADGTETVVDRIPSHDRVTFPAVLEECTRRDLTGFSFSSNPCSVMMSAPFDDVSDVPFTNIFWLVSPAVFGLVALVGVGAAVGGAKLGIDASKRTSANTVEQRETI